MVLQALSWNQQDFEVFDIPGLEPRMEALISRVRPKLTALGAELAPDLSEIAGETLYPHVAKHARRTVNPPNDTWVAWANNKRGYKALPHFQVGLWSTHLFIQFAIIYECERKGVFAKHMASEIDMVIKHIPGHYFWSVDHMQPNVTPHRDMSRGDIDGILKRLTQVKKAEILCGLRVDRNDPILENGQALAEEIRKTFKTVAPLYKMAF
jgi:uncharacterized protein YktB (UPF0637 family)